MRRSFGGGVGVAIVAVVAVVALIGPVVVPHDPIAQELRDRLLPPWFLPGGSTEHLLGTDGNGRDLFARVVFGSRVALLVGVVAVLIGVAFGALLGTVAGYTRGVVDRVISTLFDAVLAFPALVLATALVASRGRSVTNVVVVIGLVSVPLFGRVARAATLSVAERDFVAA
ncbi:MAG TPA: ABC transporter permease subunit, partial [Candidatus Limnocylindrales bacterium]|nr:ABC transporter permease subunit [Candidatus Limnocylindrales bacterium]